MKEIERKIITSKLMEKLVSDNAVGIVQSLEFKDTENKSTKIDLPNDLFINIEKMESLRINSAHKLIYSHRKYIGGAIVFMKKVVRRLLKWYINPICNQQTEFNNAVVPSIGRLTENLSKVIFNQDKVTQAEPLRVAELEVQASRIAELEMKVSRIDELEMQVTRIDELVENIKMLSNNCIDYEEKIQSIYNEVSILPSDSQNSIFEKMTYSQSGEDSIIAYILFVLGFLFKDVTYLDLGANHPKLMNNTYYLYKNGAKGVLVEANPQLIKELKHYRHNDTILNKIISDKSGEMIDFYIMSGDGLSTTNKSQVDDICKINPNVYLEKTAILETISVQDILTCFFDNKAPTILSIDIEGKDMEILRSIDFDSIRPLIIVAETIKYKPYLDINMKEETIANFLITKNYVEYAFTGINSIYLDERYMNDKNRERETI
ncbi:MAG: FkbM family methyltransferase [Oscillospiraceae bacterium]